MAVLGRVWQDDPANRVVRSTDGDIITYETLWTHRLRRYGPCNGDCDICQIGQELHGSVAWNLKNQQFEMLRDQQEEERAMIDSMCTDEIVALLDSRLSFRAPGAPLRHSARMVKDGYWTIQKAVDILVAAHQEEINKSAQDLLRKTQELQAEAVMLTPPAPFVVDKNVAYSMFEEAQKFLQSQLSSALAVPAENIGLHGAGSRNATTVEQMLAELDRKRGFTPKPLQEIKPEATQVPLGARRKIILGD